MSLFVYFLRSSNQCSPDRLWRDRSVPSSHSKVQVSLEHAGRNGGHLSYTLHEDFAARQFLYGADEALREVKLQQYTVNELLKLVRAEKQEAELDLVSGGRVGLFFTEEEYVAAKADYEAAEKAGVDLRFVEWLSKEEVQEVCIRFVSGKSWRVLT